MNKAKIEKAIRDILEAIGENPKRKDLLTYPTILTMINLTLGETMYVA